MPATIVAGPPLSGKTTYAQGTGLPYLDWDEMYAEVSGMPLHVRAPNDQAIRSRVHHRFREAVRASLHSDTVIVRGAPLRSERDMFRLTKGVSVVVLVVPYEECVRRLQASRRPRSVMAATRDAIRQWWLAYQPSPHDVVRRWSSEVAA